MLIQIRKNNFFGWPNIGERPFIEDIAHATKQVAPNTIVRVVDIDPETAKINEVCYEGPMNGAIVHSFAAYEKLPAILKQY